MAASSKPDFTFLQLLEEKYLECSLCFEEYNLPKSLRCLHSFCENCLVEYAKHNPGDIVCPTCREITPIPQGGVSKLKNNFLIKSLTDDASLFKNQSVKCNNCDRDNIATMACVECSHYLCADCFKGHQSIKSIRESHTTFEIEKLSNVVNLQQFQRNRFAVCAIHNEPKKLFCKTDNIQLCHTCAFTATHKSHEVFSLQEQVDLLLSEINTALEHKTPTESTIDAENKKLESVITDANESKDKSLRDLKKEKDGLIQKIQERYDSLESEIEVSVQETITACEEKIQRNNAMTKSVKNQLSEKEALKLIPIASCQQAAEAMLCDVKHKLTQLDIDKVSVVGERNWKCFIPNAYTANRFTTGDVVTQNRSKTASYSIRSNVVKKLMVDKSKAHYKHGRNVMVGDHVVRGPDWPERYGDQDGGLGYKGVVTEIKKDSRWGELGVRVVWNINNRCNTHRMGFVGKYELELAV